MSSKSNFTIPAVAALCFCFVGQTLPALADILHVPGDFPTIQAAIENAVDMDEIVVAPATYFETINFLGKAIWLHSSEGPEVTIIDAQQTGTVVTCDTGEGSDTVLEGFTIIGGNASNGGGMVNSNSSPTITNCRFTQNTTSSGGGGMYNVFESNPSVINCIFSENSAAAGGGMFNIFDSSPSVTDCVFIANTADGGGGIYNQVSSPTISNCVFIENSANSAGGGMFNAIESSPTVINCVLWGDMPDEILNDDDFSMPTVSYSDVQGGLPAGAVDGGGNIDADPLFVDPDNGDLRLSSGSPCIDAGDNTAVPKGITTDLDGNPRFVDDPDIEDTGFGDPPIVDLGAYEFQVMNCPWDLNGDGVVDHHDLVEVVHNLGRCDDPDDCPWDVNGDGIVNGRDVAAVAMSFGACP